MTMPNNGQENGLLDEIDQLAKGMNIDLNDPATLDTLLKSVEGGEGDGDLDDDDDDDLDGDDDGEGEGEGDGDDLEKAVGTSEFDSLMKGFSSEARETVEANEFLLGLTQGTATALAEFGDKLEKGMVAQENVNLFMAGTMKAVAIHIESLQTQLREQSDLVKGLQATLDQIGNTPAGVRALRSATTTPVVQRQFAGGPAEHASSMPSPEEVAVLGAKLEKAIIDGRVPEEVAPYFDRNKSIPAQYESLVKAVVL